jgi:hypothetical protein
VSDLGYTFDETKPLPAPERDEAIRNYDPCISCSAHFLDLTVERSLSAERSVVSVSATGREPVVVIGIGNEFRRDDGAGPAVGRTASSHGFGLDDAVSLAAALDRMPGRLIVHAIEAADLTPGLGLTPLVAGAVGTVARAILDDIRVFSGG